MNSKLEKQNPKIFPPWPYFGDDEIKAVEKVLRSGKVNQWTGFEVTSFKKEYADFAGVKYAVALANGSVALELALKVLGIGQAPVECASLSPSVNSTGQADEVIASRLTFIGGVTPILFQGATPVFIGSDRRVRSRIILNSGWAFNSFFDWLVIK